MQLTDWAKENGVEASWARRLAADGKVPGAFKQGRDWKVKKHGDKVPLSEWAKKRNMDPSNARKLARAGRLPTAELQGRDWWINPKDHPVPKRGLGR